ncbi:hypothetical protein IFM89_034443 [Coptis chinensis]|uniref:Uncharacterized protein n=1 Tax=Coptis chinensis TaxID=261450 RepID=A0A835IZC4_9MAGN|nr:hypothetical protein IFM89_034443 [Coptis chinensis]
MAQSWNWYGKEDNQWDLSKHPSLFSESLGVLMATPRRFDWTKNWELQDVGDKEWLWDNIKDKWELDETRRSPLWLDFGGNSETKRVNGKGTFIPAMPHMKNDYKP